MFGLILGFYFFVYRYFDLVSCKNIFLKMFYFFLYILGDGFYFFVYVYRICINIRNIYNKLVIKKELLVYWFCILLKVY